MSLHISLCLRPDTIIGNGTNSFIEEGVEYRSCALKGDMLAVIEHGICSVQRVWVIWTFGVESFTFDRIPSLILLMCAEFIRGLLIYTLGNVTPVDI